MDTRPVIDESAGPVSLSIAFNRDSSCFSIGLDTGFCVFNSNPCELKVSRDFNAGIGVTEMLDRTNYIALVGGGRNPKFSQNNVIIWDDAKQKASITLEHKTAVLRVRLSKSRIIAVLQNSVHVYAFSSPPTKIAVFETADNPLGLCCLGSKIVAFPGRSHGKIQLVELESGNVSIIPAHSSALRAMTLSPDGELLATASETGTLIRVFSTTNCARVAELRRGVDPAFVFSLAISPASTMLAVTSDKSTLHIFDLPSRSGNNHQGTWAPSRQQQSTALSPTDDMAGGNQKWGILSKLPLLPRVFSDVYSFTSAHFEMGDEYSDNNQSSLSRLPALGTLPSRVQKGEIGWIDDTTILIVGAGRDSRWERYRIGERRDGPEESKRAVWRDGWKRYLGS